MQPKNQIKNGFLISKGRIYDTRTQTYKLEVDNVDGLIIYRMKVNGYTRLDFMEYLLKEKTNNEIFKILESDSRVKNLRKKLKIIGPKTLLNMSNMSMVYMYPPKYLTQKKFYLYKSCQSLKKRLN